MPEVQLAKFGLMTLEQAAQSRGVSVRTVQRWIEDDSLSFIAIGPPGKNQKRLVIAAEVAKYEPEPVGRPVKDEKPKPKKGRPA